jgi:PAS domain S-box-containing protein
MLLADNAELRARMEGAEETLRAIRNAEVDALIIESAAGPRVYTLHGVDSASNRFRGEILAQVSDAVIAIDGHQHVTYANAAAERQYGLGPSWALGQLLSKVYESRWLHPEDQSAAESALRERGEWRGENVHVRQDGRELHVESSITVLRETVGQPSGVLAVIRDISERKRAEDKVRVSEIRYRRLFEAAQDGVLLLDPDTCKITDANPFMTKLLSYAHDELVGKELCEIGLMKDEVASLDMFRTSVMRTCPSRARMDGIRRSRWSPTSMMRTAGPSSSATSAISRSGSGPRSTTSCSWPRSIIAP